MPSQPSPPAVESMYFNKIDEYTSELKAEAEDESNRWLQELLSMCATTFLISLLFAGECKHTRTFAFSRQCFNDEHILSYLLICKWTNAIFFSILQFNNSTLWRLLPENYFRGMWTYIHISHAIALTISFSASHSHGAIVMGRRQFVASKQKIRRINNNNVLWTKWCLIRCAYVCPFGLPAFLRSCFDVCEWLNEWMARSTATSH